VVVAVVLALVVAPPALSSAYDGLVTSLRLGASYSLVGPGGAPTAAIPPFAPGLAAYSPLSGRFLLAVLAAGAVVLVIRVTYRRAGYGAAVAAAVFAAISPAVWGVQLGVALAGLSVLGAVALADPTRLRMRRAIGAGVLCGVAGLARPDALVAVPVLMAWIVWNDEAHRRGTVRVSRSRTAARERAWARAAGLLAAAAVVMAPWLTYVRDTFDTVLPADTWQAALADPHANDRAGGLTGLLLAGVCVAAVGALLARRRFRWAVEGRDWLPFLVLPLVCVAITVIEPAGRDAFSWSGLLVTVVAGWAVAPTLTRRRSASASRPASTSARRQGPGAS
jgi:hypothetical protein